MVIDNLIADLQEQILGIKDTRSSLNQKIALKDVLLSEFALFALKDSSLLEYIHQYKTRQNNLKTGYGIQKCPSDTAMRQILDGDEPSQLQELSSRCIQLLDEEGYLLPFELKGEYLSNHL